jgi:hypothetical protein
VLIQAASASWQSEVARYDLLDTTFSAELAVRPCTLREELLATRPETVVIDEVQKVTDPISRRNSLSCLLIIGEIRRRQTSSFLLETLALLPIWDHDIVSS